MSQLVLLSFGQGSCQQGFPAIAAQLWDAASVPVKWVGSLPAARELVDGYQRWRSLYAALNAGFSRRSGTRAAIEIDIDDDDVTQVSIAEFQQVCQQLVVQFNHWLDSSEFRSIDRALRTRLTPTQEIRIIVETDDPLLRHLPWHLWRFLDDYPHAEIALSAPEYECVATTAERSQMRILAILGCDEGIDIQQDRLFLEQLPNAETVFLVEPDRADLDRWLWDTQGWDILFFAGHSLSHSGDSSGQLFINRRESLTIEQLKHALRAAIAHGLKLAVLNSCDGLGLARSIANLHIPQLIVMREPVPDPVAQAFLKHFLQAFTSGESFYPAVRQARERLQGLETQFPCASWLPVICQNPATPPLTWTRSPLSPAAPFVRSKRSRWLRLARVLGISLAVAGGAIALRAAGILHTSELWAFDQFMRWRPSESLDSRLLIVEATESDLQTYGWPLPDRVLAQLLSTLNAAAPRSIGLDLLRDAAVGDGSEALSQQLQNDRTIVICKHADLNEIGTPPPAGVPVDRIGFNDVVVDPGDTIRRHLLVMHPEVRSGCEAKLAFSLQLAMQYLAAENVPISTQNGYLQLGTVALKPIDSPTAAYQTTNLSGHQIFLNYRRYQGSPADIIQRVTLGEVLDNQVSPAAIQDRIVLVGVTASSIKDEFNTPYGEKLRGLLIHAQMISQLLSATLDNRSLLWTWSRSGDFAWIGAWSIAGGLVGWGCVKTRSIVLANGAVLIILIGTSFAVFLQGGWVPLVPAALGAIGSSLLINRLQKPSRDRLAP